mmetsp:Transcript_99395/g.148842  ORF Transcript_99395/g.148842 Transcript_99395/m.148842 type:complete len:189 (-) Transcript_99395:149-715(-)
MSEETKAPESKAPPSGNFLTKSSFFKTIVTKTFEVCDANGTGEIKKEELYAGLLLVHLKLAKFAGPAACYPPTRDVCDTLFDAADHDNSGGIDKQEFVKIMGICCAQILSRMLVYYLILVLLVPIVAAKVVDIGEIPAGSYQEMAAEQVISMSLFYVAIPLLWNAIDDYSHKGLQEAPTTSKEDTKTD